MTLQEVQVALQATAQAALETILEPSESTNYASQFPILYDNQSVSRAPDETKWAHVAFLNSDNSPFTMGTDGEDKSEGVLNINVYYKLGDGADEAMSDFEVLREAFRRGWIAYGDVDQVVFVKSTKRVTGESDNRFVMTCVVYWYAYIAP